MKQEDAQLSYSDKLKHPKWQRKRLLVLDRDDFTCQLCNDTETCLHVHHLKYYGDDPWDVHDDDLLTLCEDCHWVVENLIHGKKLPVRISYRNSRKTIITFYMHGDLPALGIYTRSNKELTTFFVSTWIDIYRMIPKEVAELTLENVFHEEESISI